MTSEMKDAIRYVELRQQYFDSLLNTPDDDRFEILREIIVICERNELAIPDFAK